MDWTLTLLPLFAASLSGNVEIPCACGLFPVLLEESDLRRETVINVYAEKIKDVYEFVMNRFFKPFLLKSACITGPPGSGE